MPRDRIPLFVRLPRQQADALDRLADTTGHPKQRLVSDLLAERLAIASRPMTLGRVEVSQTPVESPADVLTLEEAAALLKLPVEPVRARAEEGDLPGRRFGTEWRFAR